MWGLTSDVLLAFFDRHVNGGDTSPLDALGAQYPELTMGKVLAP